MIIYKELESIESDLGFSAKTLYAISNNLSSHYHSVDIKKKNGGIRTLSVPNEELKKIQRKIVEKLLVLEPVSSYAMAYRQGTNILKNATSHTAKKRILKLDICNFFDSVKYSLVKEKAFPKERYSEKIRILLSMLCYYKDVLPQGAPTSPIISNIILYDFDNAVGNYCKLRNISYTRYCDDMTFSGDLDNISELICFIKAELRKSGFILNAKKSKVISNSRQQRVTGIIVNEKNNISDNYKRILRKEVYFIEKFGISSHMEKIGSDIEQKQYLNSLLGKINFVLQVCPSDNNFIKYKKIISDVIKNIPS